ncbi:hypothetical protein M501DRAFT_1014257 [Patellaria atrata CBS 101060]|uniref:Uncharacterized protein n=1 Tax=Patellaria atrata CBS 101060 TaxID=1346257 RepID=A0A9P4SH24_9PEZI|nr:hypothetical protein M501DRAFT_1014257 [Patellaria atrata CBS 101060]
MSWAKVILQHLKNNPASYCSAAISTSVLLPARWMNNNNNTDPRRELTTQAFRDINESVDKINRSLSGHR